MLNLTKIYALLFLQILLLTPFFMACSRDDDDCHVSNFLLHADYTTVESSIIASDEEPFFSADWDTGVPIRRNFHEFLALDITFHDSVLRREKLSQYPVQWGPSQAWACPPSEERYQYVRSVDTITVELLGDTATSTHDAHFQYFLDMNNPGVKAPSISAALEENKKVSPQIRTVRCVAPVAQFPLGRKLQFKTTIGFDDGEEMTSYSGTFFIE